MPVEPAIQAKFERNLIWERSWPKCFLAVLATVEILLALVKIIFACNFYDIQSLIHFRLFLQRKSSIF